MPLNPVRPVVRTFVTTRSYQVALPRPGLHSHMVGGAIFKVNLYNYDLLLALFIYFFFLSGLLP